MKRTILTLAAGLALFPAPAFAQAHPQAQPEVTLEQRMLLRCSAAFALIARQQQAGDKAALAWPDLTGRGSEYFVRASARVMDETGIGREGIAQVLAAEAQDLVRTDTLATVMPPCLLSLEASGL